LHGGRSLKGPAHPNYKTGRHSKYLPKKLLPGYAEMRTNAELLQQRDEIALLDSMIFAEMKKMEAAETGELWVSLGRAWRKFETAQRANDLQAMAAALKLIEEYIRRGAHEHQQQNYVISLMERKRRFIESQGRREEQEGMLISYEDAAATFDRLVDAIVEEFGTGAQVARLFERFAEITGRA
jgi:hypothetical protein